MKRKTKMQDDEVVERENLRKSENRKSFLVNSRTTIHTRKFLISFRVENSIIK